MEPASSPSRAATWQLLAFAVLAGLLAVAVSGYRYGQGPSALHLTEVLRTLDADFLAGDVWLNAQDAFGPRFYYRLALAAAALVVPLWLVYAAAYVLAAVATSVATALAVRDLAGSTLAAFLAVPLVMWTVPYELGTWPAISNASGGTRFTNPQLIAEPLCLLALWQGIRGRPLPVAAISVLAIVVHPTFGLGSAAVAFAAALARICIRRPGQQTKGGDMRALAAGGGIVAVAVGACWIVPGVLSGAIFALDGSELVHLLAHLRHPEHLVPSTWEPLRFWRAAVFWAAGILALAGLRPRFQSGELAAEQAGTVGAIAAAFLAVGCAFLCGWFFVEVVPSRWAATAYFFRLRSLATWLCWIVLAAVVADAVRAGWQQARMSPRARPARLIAWLEGPPLRWAVLACLAALLVGGATSAALRLAQWLPDSSFAVRMARHFHVPRPVFTLRTHGAWIRSGQAGLAAAARNETPPDATFLVPYKWVEWRLLAERAVVADGAFPFREDQMQAWHQRYLAVFDLAHGIGYPSRATERWLRELSRTIRFDYAVVPRSSCLRWRTVAVSGEWKLVAVES